MKEEGMRDLALTCSGKQQSLSFVLERLRHGTWELAKVMPLFTIGSLSITSAHTHSPWSKGSHGTEVKIFQVQILI